MTSVYRRIIEYLPERRSLLFYLCSLVMVASLVLGGGTRGGFLSDALLQLIALPLLLVALWNLFDVPISRQGRWALLFCSAVVLVPIIQLLPLPPALWTALPSRTSLAEAIALTGRGLPWMPLSISPHATWLSLLSLIPAVAIFAGTLLLSVRERRLLSLVILAVGLLSVFVGLIQIAQGQSSPLRFFEITNTTEAVGFFANRNHFAALLYSLTLFAAAWAGYAALAASTTHRRVYETGLIVPLVGAFTALVVLVAAQAMARSRGGLALAMVALFGAFVLGISGRRDANRAIFTPAKLLVGAIVVGGLFAVQFALYRILERFTADPLEDARIPFARNTIEAAMAYMPFGSGLGTFVPVYGMFEKPEHTIANTYANRAHNDLLEMWLEGGVLSLVLVGLLGVWLTLRSIEVWRHGPPSGAQEIDWSLARAATLIIALLIAHSFVDYPLRTGAVMAIMAFACALLIRPPVSGETMASNHIFEPPSRHRGARRPMPSVPISARPLPTPLVSTGPGEATSRPSPDWTAADIEWPEAWRRPPKQSPPRTDGNQSS